MQEMNHSYFDRSNCAVKREQQKGASMYEQINSKHRQQTQLMNKDIPKYSSHKSAQSNVLPIINQLRDKENSVYYDCRVIQRMGESWEHYTTHISDDENKIFPYCNSEYAKATWSPPINDKTFDIKIVLHIFDKDKKMWKSCGYVQAVLSNQILMFHTQSNGGNVGVATILFPKVLEWVSTERGKLDFCEIQMNPAGGAASKTVIGLLSKQLGEEEHYRKANNARDRRKAANIPLPDDPNKWSEAYNEEFAEYFYSLKSLGFEGLTIGSEGFNLIGGLNYIEQLEQYLSMLKQNLIISSDTEMQDIYGEDEFEKLLTLFKTYLTYKANNGSLLAGCQITIGGNALESLLSSSTSKI